LIAVILFFQCTRIPLKQTEKVISFNKKDCCSNCGSGFWINPKLDPSDEVKGLYAQYVYSCLIDNETCNEFPSYIFERKSFFILVTYVYESKEFEGLSIYEYPSRWKESYVSLALNCPERLVRVKIANYLLRKENFDGLIIIWENNALVSSELEKFSKSIRLTAKEIAALCIVYRNNLEYHKFEFFKQKLKETDKSMFDKVAKLSTAEKVIPYSDFVESVLGGY
jgi:hypothetical protein